MNRQTELVYAAALCLLLPCLTPTRLTGIHTPPLQREQKPARIKDLSKLNDYKVTLTLADTSILKALADLFKEVNVNYCIVNEASIGGTATFSVKDVPFEGALVSILRSSRRCTLNYHTTQNILYVSPPEGFRVPGNANVDPNNLRVKMNVEDVDVRYVLQGLLQSTHSNYTMSSDVSGNVTVSCDSIPFSEALNKTLKACKPPLEASVENNLYKIRPVTQTQ